MPLQWKQWIDQKQSLPTKLPSRAHRPKPARQDVKERRTAPRFYRRVDRHHHPSAVRHDDAGAGLRYPDRLHGGHASGGGPSAGGQDGVRASRLDHQVHPALRRRASRRHHRFPLPDRYQADFRETSNGRGRRPNPSGEQEGFLCNGHLARRALCRSQARLHRLLPGQFPRRPEYAACILPRRRCWNTM